MKNIGVMETHDVMYKIMEMVSVSSEYDFIIFTLVVRLAQYKVDPSLDHSFFSVVLFYYTSYAA